MNQIRESVRERYAAAAVAAGSIGCCDGEDDGVFGSSLYAAGDQRSLPVSAVQASLGCGNPVAVADLKEGETVLDLGSGGGLDVLLSARRVGPSGKAIGIDMTDEMLALAERNRREAGIENAQFLRGDVESLPLPDSSVDVVISNCVLNLSYDKAAAMREIARVLRPGGRIAVSDVVAENHLSPEERRERGSYAGCIAGALTFQEYVGGMANAGLEEVTVTTSHQVAEGMHAAVVRARRPFT